MEQGATRSCLMRVFPFWYFKAGGLNGGVNGTERGVDLERSYRRSGRFLLPRRSRFFITLVLFESGINIFHSASLVLYADNLWNYQYLLRYLNDSSTHDALKSYFFLMISWIADIVKCSEKNRCLISVLWCSNVFCMLRMIFEEVQFLCLWYSGIFVFVRKSKWGDIYSPAALPATKNYWPIMSLVLMWHCFVDRYNWHSGEARSMVFTSVIHDVHESMAIEDYWSLLLGT